MSKFKRGSGKKMKAISTASLPDIVFMLLFFFMVTTVMREFEGLDLIMPRAKMIEKLESKRHTTYIWATKDGLISVDDRIINMNALSSIMYAKVVKNPKITVSLKSDEKATMKLITDIFEFCSNEMPKWNTISISGYHIREAGSNAMEELAFTLANGIAYVQAAIEKDMDINKFGKQLSFFFNCHNHFFEEIAKFRAARRMWANIMKERFGATAQTVSYTQLRAHAPAADLV